MKKMNKKRGFTIVELSIVIAVIAILSAVLVPTFSSLIKTSKDSAAIQNAKNAYTQYLTAFDYDEADKTDADFIYVDDNGRVVAIKDGKLVDNVLYASKDAAKAAFTNPTVADTANSCGLFAVTEAEAE